MKKPKPTRKVFDSNAPLPAPQELFCNQLMSDQLDLAVDQLDALVKLLGADSGDRFLGQHIYEPIFILLKPINERFQRLAFDMQVPLNPENRRSHNG